MQKELILIKNALNTMTREGIFLKKGSAVPAPEEKPVP
jgi:hypothetical protein